MFYWFLGNRVFLLMDSMDSVDFPPVTLWRLRWRHFPNFCISVTSCRFPGLESDSIKKAFSCFVQQPTQLVRLVKKCKIIRWRQMIARRPNCKPADRYRSVFPFESAHLSIFTTACLASTQTGNEKEGGGGTLAAQSNRNQTKLYIRPPKQAGVWKQQRTSLLKWTE